MRNSGDITQQTSNVNTQFESENDRKKREKKEKEDELYKKERQRTKELLDELDKISVEHVPLINKLPTTDPIILEREALYFNRIKEIHNELREIRKSQDRRIEDGKSSASVLQLLQQLQSHLLYSISCRLNKTTKNKSSNNSESLLPSFSLSISWTGSTNTSSVRQRGVKTALLDDY